MLVFQLSGKNQENHIIQRLNERAPGISEEQCVRAVADINEYLPADWRMTNNPDQPFRILVSIHNNLFSLVGNSFRCEGEVLHIIDTVYTPSMRLSQNIPENKIIPNLYYFLPRPDYSSSPLFARQFEKTKEKLDGKKAGEEFHRIHPLTKSGIDPDHFHWIKWISSSGHILTVDYPEEGFHGKNYWNLQELGKQKNRATKNKYYQKYEEIVAQYLHKRPFSPEPSPSPFELECKLLWLHLADNETKRIFSECQKLITGLGFQIIDAGKPFEQIDTYFDDADHCLFNTGMSFRLRKKSGYVQITLKAKPRTNMELASTGWYCRLEEEAPVSKEQENKIMQGYRIQALPCRLISYLNPNCGKLLPAATVKTKRVVLTISNLENQRAEVCFDRVFYEADNAKVGSDVEIEIESKGMPRKDIEALADLLKNLDLKPVPSPSSKYERAINYMRKSGGPV